MSYADVGDLIELRRGPRRGYRVLVKTVINMGGDEYYEGESSSLGSVKWNWKAIANVSRGEVAK